MENPSREVRDFVSGKISKLVNNREESHVRASLAKLRRGVGKKPGSLPDIWEITLGELPEEFLSRTGEPTRAEWAVHTALTLFALHQQGKEPYDVPMNVSGKPLGGAVRTLGFKRGEASEEAVKRRFDAAVTADSPAEMAHHLRGLVQLLRSEGIPLDYPQLAEDLFKFQFQESRDGVRLRWGQDYYRMRKDEENNDQ